MFRDGWGWFGAEWTWLELVGAGWSCLEVLRAGWSCLEVFRTSWGCFWRCRGLGVCLELIGAGLEVFGGVWG